MRIPLLHGHAFGQISRLVHVKPLCDTDVITKKLQRNDGQKTRKMIVRLRNTDHKIQTLLQRPIICICYPDHICSSCLAFLKVADGLFHKLLLGKDSDDRHILFDQTYGSMLQLSGGICLTVNIADFLQLQAPLQADRVVRAAPDKKRISGTGVFRGKPLDSPLLREHRKQLVRQRFQFLNKLSIFIFPDPVLDKCQLNGKCIDQDKLGREGFGGRNSNLGPSFRI